MTQLIKTLAAVAAGTVLATSAFAQSAREIRGASPYDTIENEPAPKLIVDPPLPGPLAQGLFQAQSRRPAMSEAVWAERCLWRAEDLGNRNSRAKTFACNSRRSRTP